MVIALLVPGGPAGAQSEAGSDPATGSPGLTEAGQEELEEQEPSPRAKVTPDGEPSALNRAFRSTVFPAWGQITNRKPGKAVVLFSFQTYLYSRLVLETRRAWEARRRGERLEASGSEDPEVLALIDAAESSSKEHFDRRRDLLFWVVVGGFFGAMDAYIDAHLGDFDEELETDRTLFGGIDPTEGTVELGLRF